MLSICIPIYNFDCRNLLKDLVQQKESCKEAIEIIAIDDASAFKFRDLNREYKSEITYIQLENNIGRSAIRNLFLDYAQYPYLLFLDCDGKVMHAHFLQNYLNCLRQFPQHVICGGRIYPKTCPSKTQLLSWNYGRKIESKNATERQVKKYASFMSNNFVVPKKVLENIPFNAQIKQYGHEDTLFGIELAAQNIPLLHINNEVLNLDIEHNAAFLAKTQAALENLFFLTQTTKYSQELYSTVSLLKTHQKLLHSFFGKALLNILAPLQKSLHQRLLKSGNVMLFNTYKLLYYHNLTK